MKINRFFCALAAAGVAVFASCDPSQIEDVLSGNISISEASIEIAQEGGSATVTLSAGLAWELQGYTDEVKQWLAINPTSGKGSAEDITVTITALPNTGADRTAAIAFFGNVLKKAPLSISQKGAKGAFESITIAEFLEKKDTQNEFVVAGEVTEKATTATYWGIVIKDETGSLSCPFPKNWDDYKDQISVGSKVTIQGAYNYYESKQQDQMKNGNILKVEAGEPAKPAEGEIYVETFAAGFGEWTIDDKSLPEGAEYIWSADASYACVKASAFFNNISHASESWLVSPEIDLTSQKAAYLEFDQALNKHESLEVAKTQSTVLVKAEGGDWKEVNVPKWPASLSWSFINTGSIDLAAFVGKKIQIALKYTSADGSSGTWEVKNLKITEAAQEGPKEDPNFKADLTWVINDVKGIFAESTDATYKAGFAGSQDGITLGFYQNTSTTKAVAPTDLLKFYKSHVMIIESEKTIKAVRFTCSAKDYLQDITAIEPASVEFTKDAAALTLKAEAQANKFIFLASVGQVRINKIEFDFVD